MADLTQAELPEEVRTNIWLRADGAVVYESILEKKYGSAYVKHILDIVIDNIRGEEIYWTGVEADLEKEP